jgi:hypothetical protein
MSISEDDGQSWSELTKVGDWGGIVTMSSVLPLHTGAGNFLSLFHDDGRFYRGNGRAAGLFTLYQSRSSDGGKTWNEPEAIFKSESVHLCEPGAIRSPDGKQIAVLLRENRRLKRSHIMFSKDEAQTWSEPVELPIELSGDRHVAKYLPDGRLFISFRAVIPKSEKDSADTVTQKLITHDGDWVAWIGTYDDLLQGRPGEIRFRLKNNFNRWDCAYPGVEVLADGTVVTVTYGHWTEGEPPYILAVRIKPDELTSPQP